MNNYNQKYQSALPDLIKSGELTEKITKGENGYSDNPDNDKFFDLKEYPCKKTTFSKIKYV